MAYAPNPVLLANRLTAIEPGRHPRSMTAQSAKSIERVLEAETQSLTESIREHVYENGRRYHRQSLGKYELPSDETEQDRLDMTHAFFLELLDGKLNLAPLTRDPLNVLDCGTGTGIWALDFGDRHPDSTVIGVDLAPIQPIWVAPNVHFELDDLEKEWLYPENYFDLIHSRHISVGIKDWQRYMYQMYKHCKCGGYVEIAEHSLERIYCDDGTMPQDSVLNKYMTTLVTSLEKMGVSPHRKLADYKRMLIAAGFVDIQAYVFKLPIGAWPKHPKLRRLGAIVCNIAATGFEAYGRALMTNYGGVPDREVSDMIDDCLRVMYSAEQHVYNLHWHIVARKPE